MSSNTNSPSSSSSDIPRINSITPVASTKWLALQTIDYTDEKGQTRKWDVATRTTKQEQAIGTSDASNSNNKKRADAVVIIPLLKKAGLDVIETLLVEQYRPPVGQTTIEFPAGLIDKGESIENAALRELREETGYVGEKCKVIPQVSREVCMSPGLTDETVHCVTVEVDLDNPYNRDTPKPQLDDGEYVTVKRVNLKDGLKTILEDAKSMPIMGLYLFAMGLEIGMDISK